MNYETVFKCGNAIEPYREVERQAFHTELASLLYGSMKCPQLPQYHYWTAIKRPIGLNPPSQE